MDPKKASVKLVVVSIIVIIVAIFIMASITVVPAGHVGVVVLFGKVRPNPLQPGIHLINPLASTVKMETRLREYTMSIAREEGVRKSDDAIDALTSEGLTVRLDLTAWFRLNPEDAPKVYSDIGANYDQRIIRPTLRTAIRDIVVQYTAENIYSVKRDTVVTSIHARAAELIAGKGMTIERILLRNVILPQLISDAIDAKLAADQDARKMEFVLQKEHLEKERKVVEAEGIREANRIIAQGLTSSYIQWYRIEMLKQLVNSPNNTIIMIPEDLKSSPVILNTN
ncbi:MAG TPA: prohibitin family protein [candidate division Zixibacteria bacterium]|nr:prohibitin family protein [candidate division Zixibacteria bacterium]